jgi:hypothetical protein
LSCSPSSEPCCTCLCVFGDKADWMRAIHL